MTRKEPAPTLSRLRSSREKSAPAAAKPGVDGTDFLRVYHEHVDFVWRYASTHGIEPACVDDVVQEVFMVVHGRLATFEQRSSLKTWIAGIAVNVVRAFRRRRNVRRLGEPLGEENEVPAADKSACEALELKQSLQFLDGVLARMSELQREAFVLCELEQFSQVEVSALLGINENTLRTRLRSARLIVSEFVGRERATRGAP